MQRRLQVAGLVAAALLLAAAPASAQRLNARQRRQQRMENRAERAAEKDAQKADSAQTHAGDWLRRYKDLSPEEQRKALDNDPEFKKLPPQRQEALRLRLQRFSGLSSQQQQRILNRMEIWEHLTRDQKLQARTLFSQIQQLPLERRRTLALAIQDMRDMTPEQRTQLIQSDRYKGMFSDHERELLSGFARLPLAPGEGGQQPDLPDE